MGPGGTSLLWPQYPRSQVPDLNGSIAALQAAAWPLRQLGTGYNMCVRGASVIRNLHYSICRDLFIWVCKGYLHLDDVWDKRNQF